MPIDHVKENRFAIITIMLKQIAADLREKWPEYHIKAHPMKHGISRARLVVRNKDTRVIFDLRQGPPYKNWQTPNPRKDDPNEYTTSVQITIGNDVARKKAPQPWSFSLDDPESVTNFEVWAVETVQNWINVNSSERCSHSSDKEGSGSE